MGGCIQWIGQGVRRGGYARFGMYLDGRSCGTSAHRAAWLAHVGDIPADLVVDHLCKNRLCVNVEHMELVTSRENVTRADMSGNCWPSRKGKGRYACRKHGRADGREYIKPDGGLRWKCRTCARDQARAARSRKKVNPSVDPGGMD